jgi:hypothetical protein
MFPAKEYFRLKKDAPANLNLPGGTWAMMTALRDEIVFSSIRAARYFSHGTPEKPSNRNAERFGLTVFGSD